MSRSATLPEIDLSWRMREREAQLLAELMRSSRLTLLHAEPGIGRTDLLAGGLLPLLRRRASDAVGDEDRDSRVVIPFSDRRLRRAGRSSTRVAERVVLFDGWGARPSAALQTAILASLPADAITYARSSRLAPMLGELSRRFDAHFLIILDSFERFWNPELTPDEAEQFVDELSEAVNSEALRTHFLLSIDDLAEPRLDALRQRIHGFDDSALHLLRWQSNVVQAQVLGDSNPVLGSDAKSNPSLPVLRDTVYLPPASLAAARLPAASPASVSTPSLPAQKKTRRPRPPRVPFVKPEPIKTEGVYAFIESTLSQTASDFAPWQDAAAAAGGTYSKEQQAPSQHHPPAGSTGRSRTVGAGADGNSTEGRVGHPSAVSDRLIESSSPIDKWLDTVFAWGRRLLRRG